MSVQDIKILRDKTGAGFLDCKKALEANSFNMNESIKWLQVKGISKAAKKTSRIAAEGLITVKENKNTAVIVEINSETDFVAKNEQFIQLTNKIADAILKVKPTNNIEALAIIMDGKTIEENLITATATIGEKISFRKFAIFEKTNSQIFGPYIHAGGKIGTIVTLEKGTVEAARGIAMHVAAINPQYYSINEIPQDDINKKIDQLTKEAIDSGKPENIAEKIAKGKLDKELSQNVLTKQEYVKGEGETVEKYLSSQNALIVSVVRFAVGEGIEKKEDDFVKEVAAQVAQAIDE